MFLLAARLALRISDIIRLKLKNIDWDRNIVRIEQFKTGKVVELPLLVEVGNAIIDYLRSERPVCNDEHVFISLKPPFQRVSKDTVNTGFRKAFSDAGINAGRRHHGIHAMRHSLASELLSSQVPLPTISGILGHTSQTSTMNYLRVDIEAMKCCLLPVPPVPDEFYNQKGGILYE
jgi:integrase